MAFTLVMSHDNQILNWKTNHRIRMNISRMSNMIITQAAIVYTRFIPNWAYSIFRLQVVVVVVLYLIIISLIAAMLNSISDWENFQLVSKLNNWIINNSRVMQYDSYWFFFHFRNRPAHCAEFLRHTVPCGLS